MPRGKLFTKPEVPLIVRDNEIVRPTLRGRSANENANIDEIPVIQKQIPVEGIEPVTFLDPFQEFINETLDRVINKSIVLESEAIALQNKIISQLDGNLVGAPDYIIEMINNVIESPVCNDPNGNCRTQLTECEIQCLSKVGGLYGEPDTLEDELEKLQEPSESSIKAFENETKKIGPKVTGLWLFFFMVRFIVAYAVHVSLGFMCCYLRNKLKIKIGPFRIKFGIIIARPIGALERILKDLLGFPCGEPSGPCLKPGDIPTEAQFSIFKCCQPGWDSCGGGGEESESNLSLPPFSECFQRAARYVADLSTGNTETTGEKPCTVERCEPESWTDMQKNAAKHSMDWLLTSNQAKRDSRSGAQINQGEDVVEFYNSSIATDSINTARSGRTMTVGLKSSFNENYEYTGTFNLSTRGLRCGVSLDGANPLSKLGNFGDLTQDDILEAFRANVDTDFTEELRRAEAEGTTIDFNGGDEPTLEPFKSIFLAVKTVDETLGRLMDEMRKGVSGAKMLSGLLTDRIFCCVIYSIVVLGNLVRYQKLCPDKDLAELFDYAQDFGDNKDVQKIIKFLRLLEKLLEALNAEIAQDIEFTGVGLPLGTMLELLKRGIAQSIVALLAVALAPIDQALTALENNARIKALLNDNCFGIGDLFSMLGCGIKWIYDLIKKWAMELIPLSARNIELVGNFRITGFRMAFFLKLLEMIRLLLDILTTIGDCYPPETVPEAIMNRLDDQEQGPAPKLLEVPQIPPIVGKGLNNYQTITFEDIGNAVVDQQGRQVFPDSREEVISDYVTSTTNSGTDVSFPILSEAVKIGFVELIRKRNGLNLLETDDTAEVSQFVTEDPVIRADIGDSREQILKGVLNMVENLKKFK